MNIVAYYRVSTAIQGADGLGIAAQRAAVRDYARTAKAKIVAEYTEVQSGRRDDRPELAAALAHAERVGATLVVAKLDRLSRSVGMITRLLDSDADVRFLDLPAVEGVAGRMLVQLMAVFAEFESRRIGERIAAAHAEAKRRNTPGYRRWRKSLQRARRASHATRRAEATAYYETIRPVIQRYLDAGHTLAWIAWRLNEDRVPTRGGGTWRRANVWRVMHARR